MKLESASQILLSRVSSEMKLGMLNPEDFSFSLEIIEFPTY
jgi:hypothetical protein